MQVWHSGTTDIFFDALHPHILPVETAPATELAAQDQWAMCTLPKKTSHLSALSATDI